MLVTKVRAMNRESILLFALGEQSHLERRTWKGRKKGKEEKSCDIRKENKGHRGILSRVTVKKKIELKLNFFSSYFSLKFAMSISRCKRKDIVN